jgi:hypothetical protein
VTKQGFAAKEGNLGELSGRSVWVRMWEWRGKVERKRRKEEEEERE